MTTNTDFSNEDYKKIITLLDTLDINASSLKKNHLFRRIQFRMQHTKCTTFYEYYNYVLQDQVEKNELKLAFSINVTHFFRNIDTFDYIKKTIIPKILKSVLTNQQIKFWSAGCADGAEPYSLAILLDQLNISPTKAHIVATDYNSELLSKAQVGIYTLDYLKETPLDIQQRYFIQRSNKSVEIKSFLKTYVDFRIHDLTTSTSQSLENTFDVILCRYVFIYFTREQQLEIFNAFYKVLKQDGFLIIGPTESIPISMKEKFPLVENTHSIAIKV